MPEDVYKTGTQRNSEMWKRANLKIDSAFLMLLVAAATATAVYGQDWKNQIVFPDDSFRNDGVFNNDPGWVKFTIKLDDANTVYFQDSQLYVFHYDFATAVLPPFIGMSPSEYYDVTLHEVGQQAVLGTVILPPITDDEPPVPFFLEYGIQFVRYDPYFKEEIRDMFNVVKTNIFVDPCLADPNVQAFYFPTYEQLAVAEANRDWFEAQGIPVSSTARWAEGNACYSEGWALGDLKFFPGDQIEAAYLSGNLLPGDILLTDGVPAEIPFVAGVLSLLPSTPNSHVAILARTFGVPFAHLALAEDANHAQQLIGHKVVLRASDAVKLIDVEGALDETTIAEILALKEPPELNIQPMASFGDYSADTNDLVPADIQYFGGKAANYRILRDAIPDNCPVAVAFSFDLWNEFLDQTLTPHEGVVIEAGGYLLFWADNDEEQGALHTNFKLSADGEYIGLYDSDGTTLIDGLSFGPQSGDVSYGRSPDGNDNWVFFSGGTATPNSTNTGSGGPIEGLFINEFMADNDSTIQDPEGSGYPDWIELYNAGPSAIELGGMYLTDDESDPTKWMIPAGISGSTLRQEIANRLGGYSYPPADIAALSADLAVIRNMITNASVTSFSQQLQDAVIAVLEDPNYGFDVNSQIRFRSSTNVEDSNQFTGAGLYDSYSGCLADELDGDDVGPCICDPEENNERGVFRAIRKVFASFYNYNAFLERLRHDVNETDVGMALLVHHSFPDEIELANGVATLEKNEAASSLKIKLVTQLGATSVANPEPGSVPEEVNVSVYSWGIGTPRLIRSSSLVPLGATVMEWQDDYIELSELLVAAAEEFAQVTGKNDYILDFEYKKVASGGAAMPGGGVVVKQIREIPQPDGTPSITPFLFNDPRKYCIFQGEFPVGADSVFSKHRLKSQWTLETKNLWLNEPNLAESFYADAHIEYAAGGRIRSLTGKLPLWPFTWHTFDKSPPTWPLQPCTTDGWLMHHLQNPRSYELRTDNVQTLVSPKQGPILTLADFGFVPGRLRLRVEYAQAVPSWDGMGPTTTTTDEVLLCPCPEPQAGDIWQQRSFYDEVNDVSITTSFFWPPPPGFSAGYTAPLVRWDETVIEGYTTTPIVLRGYYSQTYHPYHHNFGEEFLFEPQLEPGISQDILDELQAQDIQMIHLFYGGPSSDITTYGFEAEPFYPADIDDDNDVDLVDFAFFAERWRDTVCDACSGADLTGDGQVDMDDLREFAENWLD